jgi:hypothetical protein
MADFNVIPYIYKPHIIRRSTKPAKITRSPESTLQISEKGNGIQARGMAGIYYPVFNYD